MGKTDWSKENKAIKEWIKSNSSDFTCDDIYKSLTMLLNWPNDPLFKEKIKKTIQQQVGRLVMSNTVNVVVRGKGRRAAIYRKHQDIPIKEVPTQQPTQEPEQSKMNDAISEHEIGRAIYDYIMYLREKDKNSQHEIRMLKEELKLTKSDNGNQLKEKEKIIAKLNDKIIELNRVVNNKPSSSRTFSLGEIARVSSFNK